MSHMLELPDDLYAMLLHNAESAGTTPVELLRRQVSDSFAPTADLSDAQPTQVPAGLCSVLNEIASVRGVSAEELAARWMQNPSAPFQKRELHASSLTGTSFREKYCGVYASGDADSANNDRIDMDLAREYSGDRELL